ncbi:MAG: DNA replication/repair protein RecF [Lachnospiraceae bacterium]|nr:DNA replication/repair protein RecF [Lachnospira sp.]MBR6697651.1 DNA replication/repair protein RecF [Lachnospiraceae bacterium]
MIIESIDLKNYRNYDILNLSFDKNINIFHGDNAQGKTNILEAIYVVSTTKSHRTSKDRELISFENDESHIKAIINKKGISYRIDMHLKKNKTKGIAVNGIPIKKSKDLFGIVNIVFFSPEDLNIVKNGPSERRRFIDMELCQLNKIYMSNLDNYNKSLMQRNKLLKELGFNRENMDTLDLWDMNLVKYGKEVIKSRTEFVEKLNTIIKEIHKNLTGGNETIDIKYEPSVTIDNFEKILSKNRQSDIKTGNTNYGPHKDDLCFEIEGIDVRKYGSQGQQRTVALSLKLSEIELVKTIINDNPILLLDDVLSELDAKRQNYLLNSIKDVQTIITCTGLDDFINNRFNINKTFKVEKGMVLK